MSLDFSNERGLAQVATALNGTELAAATRADFTTGSDPDASNIYQVLVTTGSTTDVDISTLPLVMAKADASLMFQDGDLISFIKSDTGAAKLTFTDPLTGLALSFADRQGERMTVVVSDDGTTRQYVLL